MPDAWFALGVRDRTENAVAAALVARGFEAWNPVHRVTRLTELPLFPGHVFTRMRKADRSAVLMTPGVLHILGGANLAEPIRDETIDGLRILLSAGLLVQPWPYHILGERIVFETPPLAGLEATLVRDCGSLRAVISVGVLRQAASVVVDPAWIRRPAAADQGALSQRLKLRAIAAG